MTPPRKAGPKRTKDPQRADALAVLNPERLLDYTDTWRRLAHEWTRMANECPPGLASKYRRTAQAALYAAYEADNLLKRRMRRADPTMGGDVVEKPVPPSPSPAAMPSDPATGDLLEWLLGNRRPSRSK